VAGYFDVSVSFVVSTSVGLSDSPIEIGRKRTCPCVRLLLYEERRTDIVFRLSVHFSA
jgi:hypothetical protein